MGRDIAPVAQWEDRAATVPTVARVVIVDDGDGYSADTAGSADAQLDADGSGFTISTTPTDPARLALAAGGVMTY